MLIVIISIALSVLWIGIGAVTIYNINSNNVVKVNKIKDFSVAMYTISTVIAIIEVFLI